MWSTARVLSVVRGWNRARGSGSSYIHVVESDRPLAYAETGKHGGIVVTTAMLAALRPDERRALLAHEHAHVEHRHDRFLVVADLATGFLPLAFAVRALRHCLERWADEEAARTVGDRTVVARAVARAALVGHGQPTVALGVLGGDVPARVEAMIRPPAGIGPATVWAAFAVAMVIASAAGASIQLHHLAAVFAAFCPG
ncbi:MAG: M56 family metallopeptidase [Acidimicrobiia bacterium]